MRRPSQKAQRGINLHVTAGPVVNASRIFKQTLSVARSELFSSVVICGTARSELPRSERLTHGRLIERIGPAAQGRRPSVTGRMAGQLSWSREVFRRYSGIDIRVINAHSVAVLPVCYLLSRRSGAKLIYDTHELETETSTSAGLQRLIFKVIERTLIARCDAVFVVNQSIADWYQRRYRGVRPLAIRNISDAPASWRPADVRGLLSIPAGKRLFIFAGSLGGGRNIRAILDAFASPDLKDHVLFLSSGGELESQVDAYCARHPNIHRLSAIPPADVVRYTAGCDAGFCLTQPSCLSHKLSLPNKAFEYAQAGLPFFFTDLPEVERLLGSAFVNWRVEDPARDLAKAIMQLTATAIIEARTSLADLQIPSWDEEAAPMIAVYTALAGPIADDRAKDHASQGTVDQYQGR